MSEFDDRERANVALGVTRRLLREVPEVDGSGLSRRSGRYVIIVWADHQLYGLPSEVDGFPIIQEVRRRPELW